MYIRHTTKEDLDTVMSIYAYAREFMAKTGNPNQWGPTNWPPRELIEKDIENKKSYVCIEDEEVIGVFFFISGYQVEPTYLDIEGAWKGNDTYGVIHRIASNGRVKGFGFFCD